MDTRQTSAGTEIGERSMYLPVRRDCQVCGQLAHGIHFGVLTCRACAAFFRRTIVMDKIYTCRRANDSCEISKNERYLCRLCRYKKCISLGMTPDNVQWNRDVLSTKKMRKAEINETSDNYNPQGGTDALAILETNMAKPGASSFGTIYIPKNFFDLPGSSTNNVTTKHLPLDVFMEDFTEMKENKMKANLIAGLQPRTDNQKIFFDISHVMKKLREIFREFRPQDEMPALPLRRMQTALQRHRKYQKADIKFVDHINLMEIVPFWEIQLYRIAEWMMHFEEFVMLPPDEKIVMFKNSWFIWQRFERISMSYLLFGMKIIEQKMRLIFIIRESSRKCVCWYPTSPLTLLAVYVPVSTFIIY